MLQNVWCSILGVSSSAIENHSDFFKCGASSMDVTRCVKVEVCVSVNVKVWRYEDVTRCVKVEVCVSVKVCVSVNVKVWRYEDVTRCVKVEVCVCGSMRCVWRHQVVCVYGGGMSVHL